MPIPVFDLHCDTADRMAWQSLSPELKTVLGMDFYNRYDTADPASALELASNRCVVSLEMTAPQPWAQCLACFVPDELSPQQSVEFNAHVSAYRSEQLAKNSESIEVTRPEQIAEVLKGTGTAGVRFAGVSTIENARLFAADMSLVEKLTHSGTLMASLSWNAAGPLASGHDSGQGLTEAGRKAVTEMERCGMVLDVSHLNDECFAEVEHLSSKPFVASHSNARALCPHKRNLTDDQFRAIRDRGGVVGLNYCSGFIVDGAWAYQDALKVTFEQVAPIIEHWLSLGGENTIALGSDWDGASVPEFIWDASHMPSFQEKLLTHFGEEITRRLCYENALDFFTNRYPR